MTHASSTTSPHQAAAPRTNLIVLLTLLLLLALTVGLAFAPLGNRLSLVIALGIAAIKAILIMAYFMHLRFSPRLVLAAAAAGFLWLMILLMLVFNDYVTR